MPSLLQSTSSHSVSSNFGNQFINSPNVSLIGTIPENAKAEIKFLLDIQIQQDVPNIQQEPFHAVKVELSKKRDYKDIIEKSIQANVINEVKNFLPKFLPQEINEALKKTPPSLELFDALTWSMLLDEATWKRVRRPKIEESLSLNHPRRHPPPKNHLKMADETQPDADPKIPKKNWFKDSPKPEVLDPDWNTVKTIDDVRFRKI
ncbi:hypothetical protein Tco_0847732 [Tanacetum coccineum]